MFTELLAISALVGIGTLAGAKLLGDFNAELMDLRCGGPPGQPELPGAGRTGAVRVERLVNGEHSQRCLGDCRRSTSGPRRLTWRPTRRVPAT